MDANIYMLEDSKLYSNDIQLSRYLTIILIYPTPNRLSTGRTTISFYILQATGKSIISFIIYFSARERNAKLRAHRTYLEVIEYASFCSIYSSIGIYMYSMLVYYISITIDEIILYSNKYINFILSFIFFLFFF